jgi:predicted MFS family arabinose efflux permease
MDSFGGGFVVQAFLVFWFRRRFGATPELMAVVFFGVGILQAGSSVVAGRLAVRIGLLNTMVFTHLPSNVLLAAVPLAPSLPAAIGLLLLRFALSQMDVPARQAYVLSMVHPEERTAAAAYTNTARYAARPVGPVAAGALMGHVATGAPFVAAGTIKAVYDLLLYATFRRAVPAPEGDSEAEEPPRAGAAGATRPG